MNGRWDIVKISVASLNMLGNLKSCPSIPYYRKCQCCKSLSEIVARLYWYPVSRLYAWLGATWAQAWETPPDNAASQCTYCWSSICCCRWWEENCSMQPSCSKTSQHWCLTLISPVKGLMHEMPETTDACSAARHYINVHEGQSLT